MIYLDQTLVALMTPHGITTTINYGNSKDYPLYPQALACACFAIGETPVQPV